MFDGLMRRGRRPSGRDLQVLFALTIVLPGVLLAVVGVRAWMQERRFAVQQLRERVDRAADLALRAFEQDIRIWQALLVQAGRGAPPPLESIDESVRRALAEPGAGAVVFLGPIPVLWPEHQAPYALDQPNLHATAEPLSAALAAAELAEVRARDNERAIALYRVAIGTLPADARAPGLLRLARTLRKAGREPEAIAIYRSLKASTERMGVLPVDLVARHELCVLVTAGRSSSRSDCQAPDLYRDLVDGRWRLTQARYLFYSGSVQGMLTAAEAETASASRTLEARKLALAQAAASARAAASLPPQAGDAELETAGPIVIVRNPAAPGAALLLSRSWLANSRWPEAFGAVVADGYRVDVHAPGGEAWFDSAPAHSAGDVVALRRPELQGTSWRVRVMPLDPASLMADVTRRRTLTLVMLLLLVGLLASGTYLTTRVVRREMEVARLQSDFVSAVSHEFRSPLTGIRQLGEMLLRGRVPDEGRRQEYYERITRESDRLSRLVENLLDLAQIDAGRRQYRFEPLDTSAWLRSVVDEARTNPSHRQTTIEARIPDALPPLRGDREALSTALHNLLDNAVKYSPGADAVWCEADACAGGITIRVRDKGVGMSDDDRRVAFERFRRGDGPINEQVKGTGLGLSLVDHIVRAHGGRVDCDSRLGEGTTFSIHLSASPADQGA